MSRTSYSTAPSVTYFNVISCELRISVEISGVIICKICIFRDENCFSLHSAGSAEFLFIHRILLVAVKNFLSTLKTFFHRIHCIERKSYTFTQIQRKSYIF